MILYYSRNQDQEFCRQQHDDRRLRGTPPPVVGIQCPAYGLQCTSQFLGHVLCEI